MLIIDDIVHLKIGDVVAAGVGQQTVYDAIHDDAIEVYNSPEHGKLLPFPSLKWDWKKKVNEYYGGDVKKYIQFQNIEAALHLKDADRATINSFRLGNGQYLSEHHRKIYEKNCRLLHLLDRLSPITDGKVRHFGAEDTIDFWKIIYAFIHKNDYRLPATRRLKPLLQKYQSEGATSVISGKFENKNPVKLGDLQRDAIIVLYGTDEEGKKFNKKQVWEHFVYLAKENGWTTCENITYQAVAGVLAKSKNEWHADRQGIKDFKLHKTLVINRERAREPNLVWQLDGTPECLWYYDPVRKTIDKLYVLKIMDSHSWKVVGYAIGYAETSHLVFEAMKMACTIHQVKPKEVRCDKGSAMQAAETKDLMENLDIVFYPTATGNARAKTIEAWQALFNKNVLVYFKNKSGANITAKTLDSRQNPDKLKANYKDYPNKMELVEQIQFAMNLWNETPDGKGITPNQKYAHDSPRKRDLEVMEQLELFCVWRKKGKNFVKYKFTFEGLTIEIQGDKYRYLPELEAAELSDFMNEHTDTTLFYVKYDPSDLSQIGMYILPIGLEEEAKNLRLVCEAKIKGTTSETYQDATKEQKELLSKYRETQRLQLQHAQNSMSNRRDVLQDKNVLNGSIEIEKVHKDRVNAAKIAVERERMLGYGSAILSDTNKELSAVSMEEELFDLPTLKNNLKKDDGIEPLDVYG